MAGYGYLLEIAGLRYALATSSDAPVNFGQTVKEYIFSGAPTSASIRVELVEGTSETGGCTFRCVNISNEISAEFMQGLKRSPRSRLTADFLAGATSCDVEDGSQFTGLTHLYCQGETFEISSISTNTLNVALAGRGLFGSEDADHKQRNVIDGAQYPYVFGFVPNLKGRRAWLWRYNLRDTSDATITASGYIQNAQWHPDGSIDFSINSMQQKLMESQVLSKPYARGRLLYDEATDIVAVDGLEVQLDSPDIPFEAPNGNLYTSYVSLTDDSGNVELVGYRRVKRNHVTEDVIVGSTTTQLDFNSGAISDFRVGDIVEIGNSPVERSQVAAKLNSDTSIRLTGELNTAPTTGTSVTVVSRMLLLPPLIRGGGGVIDMERVAIAGGQRVEEVRVLNDDQIEVFLKLLLSRVGDQTNTSRDQYPEEWGAGLASSDVDTSAFEDLRERTAGRRYAITGQMSLWDMAQWMMRSMACYIYTARSGKLHARLSRTLYPDDQAALVADVDSIRNNLVELDSNEDRIRNQWEWGIDRPFLEQSGEPRVLHRMRQQDSIDLYGPRALDALGDPGITLDSELQALAVGEILWSRVAHVQPRIRFSVGFELAKDIEPGDYIDLTWPYLPDFEGGAGVTNGFFEVIAIVPRDEENAIEIEAQLVNQGPYGLIAPAARVQGSAGSDVSLQLQSATTLSRSGTEDADHWQEGDTVRLIDYSTLDSATPITATATITAMDYATQTMTLSSVPGWLAADDLIVPGDWSTWSGRNTSSEISPVGKWQTYHVFAADETASPVAIGSDDPFEYGG